jgi:DNA-binding Xre family transcriptional regulator
MDRGSTEDFGRGLDVIASGGEPRDVVIPIRLWRLLPARLRKRLDDADTVVRNRAITGRLVPLDRLDKEAKQALDDARDIDLAEEGDVALLHEARARARAGAREAGIPAEVLRAEIEGTHPIAAWRKHRKMTQVQLAAEAGIDRGYLALIESRARAGSLATLTRIARALGCLIDDLVAEYEDAAG